ncbi:basic proline-rich protein-like [Mustela putorius furo]|uniref:Basic proline-rich protein-like n=1 Tax=Mustela putorius furo TaxID=9669 RepID=A0A8U0S4X2_MUSPF|nr:basic proline-rich protein-like [Mustela putorius furo]
MRSEDRLQGTCFLREACNAPLCPPWPPGLAGAGTVALRSPAAPAPPAPCPTPRAAGRAEPGSPRTRGRMASHCTVSAHPGRASPEPLQESASHFSPVTSGTIEGLRGPPGRGPPAGRGAGSGSSPRSARTAGARGRPPPPPRTFPAGTRGPGEGARRPLLAGAEQTVLEPVSTPRHSLPDREPISESAGEGVPPPPVTRAPGSECARTGSVAPTPGGPRRRAPPGRPSSSSAAPRPHLGPSPSPSPRAVLPDPHRFRLRNPMANLSPSSVARRGAQTPEEKDVGVGVGARASPLFTPLRGGSLEAGFRRPALGSEGPGLVPPPCVAPGRSKDGRATAGSGSSRGGARPSPDASAPWTPAAPAPARLAQALVPRASRLINPATESTTRQASRHLNVRCPIPDNHRSSSIKPLVLSAAQTGSVIRVEVAAGGPMLAGEDHTTMAGKPAVLEQTCESPRANMPEGSPHAAATAEGRKQRECSLSDILFFTDC